MNQTLVCIYTKNIIVYPLLVYKYGSFIWQIEVVFSASFIFAGKKLPHYTRGSYIESLRVVVMNFLLKQQLITNIKMKKHSII